MSKFTYVKTYGSYGDPITVAYRRSGASCEYGKAAFDVKVLRGRKVAWDPKSPLCIPPRSAKRSRIVEDVVGFYEHDHPPGSGLGRARRRRRR